MEQSNNRKQWLIPVVVAIIGLLGTIIATLPNILGFMGARGWVSGDNFVRYDDPLGTFSVEYPSTLNLDTKVMVGASEEMSMTLSENTTPAGIAFDGTVLLLTVETGIVPYESDNFSVDSAETIIAKALGAETDFVLVSNEKTQMGYRLQLESEFENNYGMNRKMQMYVQIESDDSVYATVFVIVVGGRNSGREVVEHILSSFFWTPENVRKRFQ